MTKRPPQPWFREPAEAAAYYAAKLREMRWLEKLAIKCGRGVRPKQ